MKWTTQNIKNSKVAHLNQHLVGSSLSEKPTNSKYKNEKVVDEFGNVYDSKKERKRATELRLLLKAGAIGFLAKQVEFDLKVAKYIADFVYTDAITGATIVEDVKSEVTRKLPVYRLKKKLMLQIHNIEIKEV